MYLKIRLKHFFNYGIRRNKMPTPKECSKIKDPAKRKRCLQYAGEYAKKKGSATNEMSRVRSSKQGGY